MKFSIASSALTGFLGLFIATDSLQSFSQQSQSDSSAMMMQSTEMARNTAEASQVTGTEMALIVLGGGLIVTGLMLAIYTYFLRKLGK